MMTPTQHEKQEWSRMAQSAYARGDSFTGHRYSAYASLARGAQISESAFDGLQINYRQWLIVNPLPIMGTSFASADGLGAV